MAGRGLSLQDLGFFQRGRQIIRVMNQNGQTRQFVQPIRVGDLLRCHPHHYLCSATDTQARILPLETELEQGNIYLLRPVPRLLPSLASTSPSCSCYSAANGDAFFNHGPGIVCVSTEKRTFFRLFKSFSSSRVSSEGRKVAPYACDPDSLVTTAKLCSKKREAGDKAKEILSCKSIAARILRRWTPRLQTILEDDMLELAQEVEGVSKQIMKKKTPTKQDQPKTTLKQDPDRNTNIHRFNRSTSLPFQSPIPLLFMV